MSNSSQDQEHNLKNPALYELRETASVVVNAQEAMESPILPKDEHRVAAEDRIAGNGRRGGIVWFTGLSGAGKSTLAMKLERALFLEDYHFYVLDGDNIGQRPSADIGFSPNRRLSTGY